MDFVKDLAERGLGGVLVLAFIAAAALLVVMAVLLAALKMIGFAGNLGAVFRRGWRSARQ